jgi:hypothetical protein
MSDETKHEALNDAEIALMDATKSLIEILLAHGIAKPSEFDTIFTYQRDAYVQKSMPNAAAIMEMLRQFSTTRGAERAFLNLPSAGSA